MFSYNFSDILKGNFAAEFSAITVSEMLIAIALAFVLSLFIVYIYKITYAGVCYSRSFAGCLIMIAMVTALVIQVITSNVVLSLGMVGALSIVRFRTAIKDPTDLLYLFWAMAGLLAGYVREGRDMAETRDAEFSDEIDNSDVELIFHK